MLLGEYSLMEDLFNLAKSRLSLEFVGDFEVTFVSAQFDCRMSFRK